MKNILISIALLVCVSFSYAQVEKVEIDEYNGSTLTQSINNVYVNSRTDTTAWVNFEKADSVHFYISTSDSARVFLKLIYGDGDYSKVLVSAVTDSLVTTTTGWKSINWKAITTSCGNEITGCKLQLAFQSTGNAATSELAKYNIFVKKYLRK
jgi:hypothetical protein